MKAKYGALIRIDIYLHPEADQRLIAHLERFKAARRMGDEIRRLLYSALDGSPKRAALPEAQAEVGPSLIDLQSSPSLPSPEVLPGQGEGEAKARIKLRMAFGKPE